MYDVHNFSGEGGGGGGGHSPHDWPAAIYAPCPHNKKRRKGLFSDIGVIDNVPKWIVFIYIFYYIAL